MAAWGDHEHRASSARRRSSEPVNLAGVDATRRRTLPDEWRARADQLDSYARACRRDGDTREAMDAEQAATDYRIAADEREVSAPLRVTGTASDAANGAAL